MSRTRKDSRQPQGTLLEVIKIGDDAFDLLVNHEVYRSKAPLAALPEWLCVRYGFCGASDRDEDGNCFPSSERTTRSLPCIRVLTTSNGKVASHPAIPASPPARRSTGHDRADISVSTSERMEEWSDK